MDVRVQGGKFWVATTHQFQNGWIRGKWPTGEYELQVESTNFDSTWYYYPIGMDYRDNTIAMCTDRGGLYYNLIHISLNAHSNAPTPGDYFWNDNNNCNCAGVYVEDSDNFIFLFS